VVWATKAGEMAGTEKKRAVVRIRIHRIHIFLGLLDSDPLARGMDPDPALDRIRILLSLSKYSKKKLDFYCFVTSF
jgi:hypothetical protein